MRKMLLILLALLLGTQDYRGGGMHVIHAALMGESVHPAAFLLKIAFTALSLGVGFKGGEIVPSFFVGATFGCLMGQIVGLSPSMCAAVGMICVFCGVTNCPITSLLISFELFGFAGMPYYLTTVAVSYMLSGYYGLYHAQRIMYSKTETHFINTVTH